MREGTLRIAGIVLVALAATLVALAAAPTAAAVDPENGATVYEEECWYCHGEEGLGTGLWGQPNFTQEELWLDNSEEYLVSIVKDGGQVMPGFEGNLTDQEVHDVLAYSSREFADVDYEDIGSNTDGSADASAPGATATPTETADAAEEASGAEPGSDSENGAPGFTGLAAVASALSALLARRRS